MLGVDTLLCEFFIHINFTTLLVQLAILSELFNVLLELESIRPNVSLNPVTLVFADLALLHQHIQLFFQVTLRLINLSHLLFHLQEVVLLLLQILLALFLHFLACLAVKEKFIAGNIILLNLFLQLLLG